MMDPDERYLTPITIGHINNYEKYCVSNITYLFNKDIFFEMEMEIKIFFFFFLLICHLPMFQKPVSVYGH